jgi:hypothetical protein
MLFVIFIFYKLPHCEAIACAIPLKVLLLNDLRSSGLFALIKAS